MDSWKPLHGYPFRNLVMAKASNIVIFSDAEILGSAIQGANKGNTTAVCHKGGDICAGGALVLAPPLIYSANAGQVAAFVTARSKLMGMGMGNGDANRDGQDYGDVEGNDGTGNG